MLPEVYLAKTQQRWHECVLFMHAPQPTILQNSEVPLTVFAPSAQSCCSLISFVCQNCSGLGRFFRKLTYRSLLHEWAVFALVVLLFGSLLYGLCMGICDQVSPEVKLILGGLGVQGKWMGLHFPVWVPSTTSTFCMSIIHNPQAWHIQ